MRVSLLAGDPLFSDRVVRDSRILIGGQEFPTDLIALDMRDFDVVLGMDWLSRHRAILDCYKKGSWDTHLALMEFTYNNNYQASIEMAPFEALYGRKCRTPVCWDEVGERRLVGPELVQITSEKVKVVHDNLKIARDRQKSYADNRRRDLQFEIGDRVFLKISRGKVF